MEIFIEYPFGQNVHKVMYIIIIVSVFPQESRTMLIKYIKRREKETYASYTGTWNTLQSSIQDELLMIEFYSNITIQGEEIVTHHLLAKIYITV